MKRPSTRPYILILLALIIASCNAPNAGTLPQGPDAINTYAVQTISAIQTREALNTPAPANGTTGGALASGDSLPPTATLAPTSTPLPTNTPFPTLTPIPTRNPIACNRLEFIRDVTVPDGTVLNPGARFTKAWLLRNTGSCTWTPEEYSIVFITGDPLGGETQAISKEVEPGETVEVAVDMIAPTFPGAFRSNWMLKDKTAAFGGGSNSDKPFWVEIEVELPERGTVLNFAESFCAAEWTTASGRLDCPGKQGDSKGFVSFLGRPDLERGRDDEATIWTHPESRNNGYIQGVFPPLRIEENDEFVAEVGCLKGYPRCNVTFQLFFINEKRELRKLGEWRESYNGETTLIAVDLTDLTDKTVQLVLKVTASSSPEDAAAFWLMPQIDRD